MRTSQKSYSARKSDCSDCYSAETTTSVAAKSLLLHSLRRQALEDAAAAAVAAAGFETLEAIDSETCPLLKLTQARPASDKREDLRSPVWDS